MARQMRRWVSRISGIQRSMPISWRWRTESGLAMPRMPVTRWAVRVRPTLVCCPMVDKLVSTSKIWGPYAGETWAWSICQQICCIHCTRIASMAPHLIRSSRRCHTNLGCGKIILQRATSVACGYPSLQLEIVDCSMSLLGLRDYQIYWIKITEQNAVINSRTFASYQDSPTQPDQKYWGLHCSGDSLRQHSWCIKPGKLQFHS